MKTILYFAASRPMKAKWKTILTKYKEGRGKKAQSIQKDRFPKLLKKLIDSLEPNRESNIKAGFKRQEFFLLIQSQFLLAFQMVQKITSQLTHLYQKCFPVNFKTCVTEEKK